MISLGRPLVSQPDLKWLWKVGLVARNGPQDGLIWAYARVGHVGLAPPPMAAWQSTINNIIVSGEAILSAKIVENLWTVGAPPQPCWGSSERSPRPLSWWEGVAAPSQEPHPSSRHLALQSCLSPPGVRVMGWTDLFACVARQPLTWRRCRGKQQQQQQPVTGVLTVKSCRRERTTWTSPTTSITRRRDCGCSATTRLDASNVAPVRYLQSGTVRLSGARCGFWGCKNRPAPFPGQLS